MDFPYRKSRIESIKTVIADERIKVVYGPSGCGKSSFLLDIKDHLLNSKVPPTHIVLMNVLTSDVHDWRFLIKKLRSYIRDGKKYYFLLDEITSVDEFAKALLSMKDNYLCSIFITSSNQHLLLYEMEEVEESSWTKIFLNTLSFIEVLQLKRANQKVVDQKKIFNEYLYFGGYPDMFLSREDPDVFLPNFLRHELAENVYSNHPHLSYPRFTKTSRLIINSCGRVFSGTRTKMALKKKMSIDRTTIDRYARYLEDIYLLERTPVYLESGKQYLRGGFGFYPLDNGLLTAACCTDELSFLRTAVFNKLKLDGYGISIVKTKRGYVDFRVEKNGQEAFIQCASNLGKMSQKELKEIYDLFKPLKSAAPRYVISNDSKEHSFSGIKNINSFEFISGKSSLFLI